MEIVIRTVSDVCQEENQPCSNAVLKRVIPPRDSRDVPRNEWVVNVNTIEDILAISKEVECEVCVKAVGQKDFYESDIDEPMLIIYDDNRE